MWDQVTDISFSHRDILPVFFQQKPRRPLRYASTSHQNQSSFRDACWKCSCIKRLGLWNVRNKPDRFCRRHHCLMDEIHSTTAMMFKSNPLNLAVAYNYFPTRCCEDGTKNVLIFTLWSISSDAARLTLSSGCDTAFLMPLTILNDIDNKARQDKPLRQQAGIFFPFFFFIYSCSNSFSQPWTWI